MNRKRFIVPFMTVGIIAAAVAITPAGSGADQSSTGVCQLACGGSHKMGSRHSNTMRGSGRTDTMTGSEHSNTMAGTGHGNTMEGAGHTDTMMDSGNSEREDSAENRQ